MFVWEGGSLVGNAISKLLQNYRLWLSLSKYILSFIKQYMLSLSSRNILFLNKVGIFLSSTYFQSTNYLIFNLTPFIGKNLSTDEDKQCSITH